MNDKHTRISCRKRGIIVFSLVLFLLSVINCTSPLAPPGEEKMQARPGMGILSLHIANNNNARTILPDTTRAENTIKAYKLEFTNSSTSVKSANNVLPADLSRAIYLDAGTYTLGVTGYSDTEWTYPVAYGSVSSIVIADGGVTSCSVTLEANGVVPGADGSFGWDITLPAAYDTASMNIKSLSDGIAYNNTVDLASDNNYTGSLTLDSGYYQVTITLTKANCNDIVWYEVLHVYQNMTSNFTQGFTGDDFSSIKYTVTFDYNDSGATAPGVQTCVSGGVAARPSPDPSRDYYTFDAWYTDPDAGSPYNFTTPVIGNITLYARWNGIPSLQLYAPDSLNLTMIEGFLSPQTITLKNQPPQASAAATITSVTLDGVDANSFSLSDIGLDDVAVGEYTAFTLTPQADLAIGNYSATISVAYSYGASDTGTKTFDVSLAVHSQFDQPQTISTSVNTNELINAAGAVPGWYGRKIDGRWLTMGVMEHTVAQQINVPIDPVSFNFKNKPTVDWTTVPGIAQYEYTVTNPQGSIDVALTCIIYIPNDGYTATIMDSTNAVPNKFAPAVGTVFHSGDTVTLSFSGNASSDFYLHINIQSNSTYTYLDLQPLPYQILEEGTYDGTGAFTSSGIYYWRDEEGNDSFNFDNATVSFLKFDPPELTEENHETPGSIIIAVDNPTADDFIPDPVGTDYDYSGVTVGYNTDYPLQSYTIGSHTVGVQLEAVGYTMVANSGMISAVNLQITYILDQTFSSNVASISCNGQQATGPDASGNYTVTLNGLDNGDATLETVFNFTSQ